MTCDFKGRKTEFIAPIRALGATVSLACQSPMQVYLASCSLGLLCHGAPVQPPGTSRRGWNFEVGPPSRYVLSTLIGPAGFTEPASGVRLAPPSKPKGRPGLAPRMAAVARAGAKKRRLSAALGGPAAAQSRPPPLRAPPAGCWGAAGRWNPPAGPRSPASGRRPCGDQPGGCHWQWCALAGGLG